MMYRVERVEPLVEHMNGSIQTLVPRGLSYILTLSINSMFLSLVMKSSFRMYILSSLISLSNILLLMKPTVLKTLMPKYLPLLRKCLATVYCFSLALLYRTTLKNCGLSSTTLNLPNSFPISISKTNLVTSLMLTKY